MSDGEPLFTSDPRLIEDLHELYLSPPGEDASAAFDALSERAYVNTVIYSKLAASGPPGRPIEAEALQKAAEEAAGEPVDVARLGKIRAALGAVRFVGKDEYQHRKAICDGCEHCVQYGMAPAAFMVCRLCGCLMNVKARLEGPRCPAGKF